MEKEWLTVCVATLLFNRPSIFLISWIFTSRVDWAFPVKLLVSNIIAVSCVSWISMPLVRCLLGRWMAPSSNCSLAVNIGGAVGIAVALALMLWLFLSVPMA